MSVRWTETDLAGYRNRGLKAMHAAPGSSKKPKYRNQKVTDHDGITHDSRREYRRWCELQLRALAGEISDLRRQVPYAICINGILVCQYVADFVYREGAAEICEDCKSEATRKLPVFALKRKLMIAVHGIDIRIT